MAASSTSRVGSVATQRTSRDQMADDQKAEHRQQLEDRAGRAPAAYDAAAPTPRSRRWCGRLGLSPLGARLAAFVRRSGPPFGAWRHQRQDRPSDRRAAGLPIRSRGRRPVPAPGASRVRSRTPRAHGSVAITFSQSHSSGTLRTAPSAATAWPDRWFRKPEAPHQHRAPRLFGHAAGCRRIRRRPGAGGRVAAGGGSAGAGRRLTIASRVAVNCARFCGSFRASSARRACPE